MRGGSLLLLCFIALAVSLSEQQELGVGGGRGEDGGIRQRPKMPDLSKVRAAREAQGAASEDVREAGEREKGESCSGGDGGGGDATAAPLAQAAKAGVVDDAAGGIPSPHGEGEHAVSALEGHQDAAPVGQGSTGGSNLRGRADDGNDSAAPEGHTSEERGDEGRPDDPGDAVVGGDDAICKGQVVDGCEADISSYGDANQEGLGTGGQEEGEEGGGKGGEQSSGAEAAAGNSVCEAAGMCADEGVAGDDDEAKGKTVAGAGSARDGGLHAEGANREGSGGGAGDAEGVKDAAGKDMGERGEEEDEVQDEEENRLEDKVEVEVEKGGVGIDLPLRAEGGAGAASGACPVTEPPSASSPSPPPPPSPPQADHAPPWSTRPPLSLRDASPAPARDETKGRNKGGAASKRRNDNRKAGMLPSGVRLNQGLKPKLARNCRDLGTTAWPPLPPYGAKEAPRKERMGGGGDAAALPRTRLGIGSFFRVQAASCVSYGVYYLMFEACARWMAAAAKGRVQALGPIMAAFAMSVPLHHVLLRIATRGAAAFNGPYGLLAGIGKTASMCAFGLTASPLIEHAVTTVGVVGDDALLTWVSAGVWAAYHTLIVYRTM